MQILVCAHQEEGQIDRTGEADFGEVLVPIPLESL